MFSSVVCQPQVFESAGHVFNSVRSCCSGLLIAHQRASSTLCGKEASLTKQRQASSGFDLEQCVEVLLQPESRKKVLAMLGIPSRDRLGESHVSAATFFENKTGFTEHVLLYSRPKTSGLSLFLRPGVRHLLGPTLSPVYSQIRGFKSKRRSSADETSNRYPSLESLLQNERPATQEKIVNAYVKGLDRESSDSSRSQSFYQRLRQNANKILLGALLFYVVIQIGLIRARNRPENPGGGFGLLTGRSMEVTPEQVDVTFQDVRGCDEVKQELNDVVMFLKHPNKFTSMGARLPKGLLMVGPPGVGKTLLAKAVAGEANVPFYQISGSEFDEIFVGTGAKKVRKLFNVAKSTAPSVIFIDEIDSVGAKRTNSQLHPYANQTINQLLSEMDGFTSQTGVIVIGATNKKENLDKALLRPGRFDMEVHVMHPDTNGRKELFNLYLGRVKADTSIDCERLAKLTYGMSGADIANIVNQAAFIATLQNSECVTAHHIDEAKDKIVMGPAWKNRPLTDEVKRNTAYHEAGHATVAYYTPNAMKLNKVTIISRGGALGLTSFLPEKDSYGETKAQLLSKIDVAYGGRLGELFLEGEDHVTTGASSDFVSATRIATAIVKQFGMSEKVGTRVYDDNVISIGTQEQLDSEINQILSDSYQRAKEILKKHEKQFKALAEALLEYETLNREEVDLIMRGEKLKRKSVPKKQVHEKVDLKKTDKDGVKLLG